MVFFYRRRMIRRDEFQEHISVQLKICTDVLQAKGKEYANVDMVHNFRQAADLQGVDIKKALAGMMAKHTVSIYDMCTSEQDYPAHIWEEKLTDHINYLLILSAIVHYEDWKNNA
jgi:hypothetical protein